MSRPYIVYHHPCFDGFTAAWAAKEYFGVDGAEYLPQTHGQGLGPNKDDWKPGFEEGRTIYFVDYCPLPQVLDRITAGRKIVVLDHHKSSRDAVAKWIGGRLSVEFVWDMDRSGAGITWDFFHGVPRPPLVDYVEDRDLWKFNLTKSQEIHAFLGLFPWTFEAWDEVHKELEENFPRACEFGEVALQKDKRVVEDLLVGKHCRYVGGWLVPVVNTPKQFGSDVCYKLLDKYPDAKFAAYYWDRGDGRREWGLRSRGDFDVSEVAKRYDGGGHKAAAGFTTSYHDDLDLEKRRNGIRLE